MEKETEQIARAIFKLQPNDASGFNNLCLKMMIIQIKHNSVYREFVKHLNIDVHTINHYTQIPFLPIQFFKHHKVVATKAKEKVIFESSGTTNSTPSQHFVANLDIYERSCLQGFRAMYGNPSDLCILALLPSYLERGNSSLVYMAKLLIAESGHIDGGFYLDRLSALAKLLRKNSEKGQKTLLIGVTFALLDLAENHPQKLNNIIVMETGGMKGRRKEMPREEVHGLLQNAFGIKDVHSEYGMTELLSQAYSKGDGVFSPPPWMKVVLRDVTDPLSKPNRKSGTINVIDLANIYSCPFIATSDLGEMVGENQFRVLGRTDNSDIRGCNLMVV